MRVLTRCKVLSKQKLSIETIDSNCKSFIEDCCDFNPNDFDDLTFNDYIQQAEVSPKCKKFAKQFFNNKFVQTISDSRRKKRLLNDLTNNNWFTNDDCLLFAIYDLYKDREVRGSKIAEDLDLNFSVLQKDLYSLSVGPEKSIIGYTNTHGLDVVYLRLN